MIILSASHIKKSYNEGINSLQVLTDVNLSVNAGDLISITGQSGCGKSTLLHVLGLLDDADSGELTYNDIHLTAQDKKSVQFRSMHIGFIFQFHYLLEDLTAEENIALPLLIQGLSYQKSIERAKEWLTLLDLPDRGHHYPNALSGGEQQRIAIGRAMIHKPDIVFADEPTGNLDPAHSAEVLSMMLQMQKLHGQTFVIVTHNEEIANKAAKQYRLEKGVLTTPQNS
jgi:lipoprotein-releasing system ATP-binding protein